MTHDFPKNLSPKCKKKTLQKIPRLSWKASSSTFRSFFYLRLENPREMLEKKIAWRRRCVRSVFLTLISGSKPVGVYHSQNLKSLSAKTTSWTSSTSSQSTASQNSKVFFILNLLRFKSLHIKLEVWKQLKSLGTGSIYPNWKQLLFQTICSFSSMIVSIDRRMQEEWVSLMFFWLWLLEGRPLWIKNSLF